MNKRNLFIRRLREFPDAKAFFELCGQGLPRIEPPQTILSSEEMQKLLRDALVRWNEATERSARRERSQEDPEAVCHSAIARARDSSAVAIQLASQAKPTSRRRRDSGFGAVMCRFPGIAQKAISARRSMLASGTVGPLRWLHNRVLRSLADEGLRGDEYPFISCSYGYRSFCRWLRHEVGRGLK